jgi:NADPH:quinone reductase-like Zn-dependent oxidoreductase
MKAAIVTAADKTPVYGDFNEPTAREGMELIAVNASALSQFSRSRSAGSHYSSNSVFPSVAGADGVGHAADGRRVYFALPEAPYGALAEKCLVSQEYCVDVPECLDDSHRGSHCKSRHVSLGSFGGTRSPKAWRNGPH